MSISRRWFLGGIAASIAAPAIVRASSLMPVRATIIRAAPPLHFSGGFLVPDEFMADIIALREDFALFRQECRVVPMGRDTLNWPRTQIISANFITAGERIAPSAEENAA